MSPLLWDYAPLAAALIGIVTVLFVLSGFRVSQEYQRAVVFFLGRLVGRRGPGVYWLFPLLERAVVVDIRTNTQTIEQQETITKDSVTIKVDAVLWYRIEDPRRALVKVADAKQAVYQVALTSLRNIIGQHALDEVLRDRDAIKHRLQAIVDQATEPWGIKVEFIEMKDVEIPAAMQRAMAREAEAVREKRARIIKAEAEQEASRKLVIAAQEMGASPAALELRRLQMVSEVGAEHNTTTIVLLPSDFVNAAAAFAKSVETPKRAA